MGNCENNFAGVIALAILVGILFATVAYLIYQNRRLKSLKENLESKSNERNFSNDIYENPVKDDESYEKVENEPSTYTALKRTEKEDKSDHAYCDLNQAQKDYMNQKETGI